MLVFILAILILLLLLGGFWLTKFLFIVAVIVALVWLISFFAGRRV